MPSKIYKVYEVHGNNYNQIFASSNIDDAIEAARAYIQYKPTPSEITTLKQFFKQKYSQKYKFSSNNRTVALELTHLK